MKRWPVVYLSPVSRTDKTRLDGRDAISMHIGWSPRTVLSRLTPAGRQIGGPEYFGTRRCPAEQILNLAPDAASATVA
jgi:hypothetical protein